jgi:rhodanese-related sulfurtransferase
LNKVFKFLAAAAIAVFATTSLTACAAEPMDMSNVAAVIDVRTADEWNSGHLDGAVHMDIQAADFADQIATLDPAADYVVYCRSGNRAGQAIDYMKKMGFTGEIMNAGAVSDAAGMTGMKVVQ